MLLGILGPHATGKTTYCKSLADMYRSGNVKSHHNLYVVLADSCIILGNGLDIAAPWTQGKKHEKEPHIEDMVADDTTIYVVESARFFTGQVAYLDTLAKRYSGGVKLIVVSVTYERMIENMRSRCDRRGKVFKEIYWKDAAAYENRDRYINQVTKKCTHIPWVEFGVPTYDTWYKTIHPEILRLLQLPYEEWYKCS